MRYLPNKKFVFFVVLAFLIFGGGFWFFSKSNKPSEKPLAAGNLKTAEPIIAEELDKDSDNDGLKDWEEALWGTDPVNPDTDKDGTLDGEEIKQDRNPLVPGPNDKLPKPSVNSNEETASPEQPDTLTSALSKQLFAAYLTDKQSGGQISGDQKQALLDSFMASLDSFNQTETKEVYTKSDLQISKNSDRNAIKEYGNNFALIIKKYFGPISENEMAVFQNALTKNNEKEFEKLGPIAGAYRNTAREALSLTVPNDFSDSHLTIINGFIAIAKEIDILKNTAQDPTRSLLALKQYQTDVATTYASLKNLNNYFLTKGVVFLDNEPGILFRAYLE